MKKIIFLSVLFASLVLLSCCSKSANSVTAVQSSDSLSGAGLLKEISGYWVNERYLASLRNTHSPKVAQESCCQTYLSVWKDSVLIIYNLHEGQSFSLKADQKGYQLHSGSVNIRLLKNGNKLQLPDSKGGMDTFIKYVVGTPGEQWFDQLLNKELLAGEYVYCDDPAKKVRFLENGEVKGLDGYNRYLVQMDYFDAGCDFDCLTLKQAEKLKNYTWTISKDTLLLYHLDCAEYDSSCDMCVKTAPGKQVYKLLRNL